MPKDRLTQKKYLPTKLGCEKAINYKVSQEAGKINEVKSCYKLESAKD
jgi:hypothetical protein